MSLDALVRLPTWRRYAACRGQSRLFFASDETSQRLAVAVRTGCGVRGQCLDDALAEESDGVEPFGVRGGLTASERRALGDH